MIGKTLAHFRITAKLGEGGMGEVYRAEDLNLKREVALKVLPEEMASNSQRLARFRREAEAVAALNHPNIVTIHSVDEADGLQFLTMELVDGQSLAEAFTGGLSLADTLEIIGSVADALAAAHARGIVHRDLKPSNVMLTADGRVKVLDFGLAKLSEQESAEALGETAAELPTEVKPLTEEGMIMGTAPYMSPEQAQGRTVDSRSDIFSLGCMLYEAATGRRAFQGASSIDTLHKVIHEEPTSLSETAPQAPLQLQWIPAQDAGEEPRRSLPVGRRPGGRPTHCAQGPGLRLADERAGPDAAGRNEDRWTSLAADRRSAARRRSGSGMASRP